MTIPAGKADIPAGIQRTQFGASYFAVYAGGETEIGVALGEEISGDGF